MYINSSIKNYLNELSSDKPIPGGGGTSALVAAFGIALALMVARISLRRLDKRAQKKLSQTIKLLERLRREAEETVDLDPEVYADVMKSYKQLKASGHSSKGKTNV